MKWGNLKIFGLLLSATVIFSACIFKPSKFKGVMSYRNGRVFLKHDNFYRVGVLPGGWNRMSTKVRAISFYNASYDSSISTDALCGGGVSDRSLETLTGSIVSALENRKITKITKFELDGRGALRESVEGTIDGVPVDVDMVVTRKDWCVFDFYSVSPKNLSDSVKNDFELFFGAFHYE